MARSTEEIYNSIIAEKDSLSSLDGLTPAQDTAVGLLAALSSTSKVAIWRLWAWVTAYAMHLQEVMWDTFRAEVEVTIETNRVGRLRWYVELAKKFQNGYLIQDVDGVAGYATDDPAARIVTQASAREAGSTVFLKVAKGTVPSLAPLSAGELSNFQAYMQKRKIAGITMNISSLAADTLLVTAAVHYDAILPQADVKDAVQAAIEQYILLLADPFDGELRTIRLVDAVQAVPGVLDFVPATLLATTAGGQQTTIDRSYVAAAGYMAYDTQNSVLTMIPVF